LRKALKDDDAANKVINVINDAVKRLHQLMVHVSHAFKMFILVHINDLTTFNFYTTFMRRLAKVISSGDLLERRLSDTDYDDREKDAINKFYNEHYKRLMVQPNQDLDVSNLTYLIPYAVNKLLVSTLTNIKTHYMDKHIPRFVDAVYKLLLDDAQTRKDRVAVTNIKAAKKAAIASIQNGIVPVHFPENPGFTREDLQRVVESAGLKMLAVVPLITSVVPSFYDFDTASVINLLFSHAQEKAYPTALHATAEFEAAGDKVPVKKKIWGSVFALKRREFKDFAFFVSTDGVALSIHKLKPDPHQGTTRPNDPHAAPPPHPVTQDHPPVTPPQQPPPPVTPHQQPPHQQPPRPPKGTSMKLTDFPKEMLAGKRIIGCDPGKHDLVYMLCRADKGADKEFVTFRYTRSQWRVETKAPYFQDQRRRAARNTKWKEGEVDSIEKLTENLSKFNHNTCDIEMFKKYVEAKNSYISKTCSFYSDHRKGLHRRLRWYGRINTMESEAKMINAFRETFGGPEKVIIAMGDFSSGSYNLRGLAAVPGNHLHKLFLDAGYQLVYVDEFHTSMMCSACGEEGKMGENQKFKLKPPPHISRKQKRKDRKAKASSSASSSSSSGWASSKKRRKRSEASIKRKKARREERKQAALVAASSSSSSEPIVPVKGARTPEKKPPKIQRDGASSSAPLHHQPPCSHSVPTDLRRYKVHGLLRCTLCFRLWNRDHNAALNMLAIAEAHRDGLGRPLYLQRPAAARAAAAAADEYEQEVRLMNEHEHLSFYKYNYSLAPQ